MVNAQFGTAQKSNTSYLFSISRKNMHKVGHICEGHISIKYIIGTYSMAVHAIIICITVNFLN